MELTLCWCIWLHLDGWRTPAALYISV